ncbi:hypothetical protein CCACVL1_24645, partial [Corchorus capsularis]
MVETEQNVGLAFKVQHRLQIK